MLTKDEIIKKAMELGFDDIGFTHAEPLMEQKELLESMGDSYSFLEKDDLDLIDGTDPAKALPEAQSIIVLINNYFSDDFPVKMTKHFGRCYLDDDRETKDGLHKRIKAFRGFLRDNGIQSKMSNNISHRVTAARAGLGNYGKNCFFYSRKVALKSSWVSPLVIIIDQIYEPDLPTPGNGCHEWCRNACISACPTRALKGNGTIDPRKCISYLTYNGNEITPRELREPMGLYVYGCDICQEVCPRNKPWLAYVKTINEKVTEKEPHFELTKLLHMNRDYFEQYIWPHMFYMKSDQLWKWKMNVARVMGNSLDEKYVPHLVQAFSDNNDPRVLSMLAWALGRIGGDRAVSMLEHFHDLVNGNDPVVLEEIEFALEMAKKESP